MPSIDAVRAALPALAAQIPKSPTLVVCGGTSGLGEAIARKVVSLSDKPDVHLVGRNASAASAIIADLKRDKPEGKYEFHACDLTSVADTKRLTSELTAKLPHINYLILSQGILTMSGRTETAEGNDVKMMLHYYSRIAVMQGLQGPLTKAASESGQPARVMSVLDACRGSPKSLHWDDLDLKSKYSLSNAMGHCISMKDIAIQALAKENPSVKYFHAYPGTVKTPLASHMPWYARAAIAPIFMAIGVPVEQSADSLVYALLQSDLAAYTTGGACYVDNKGSPVPNKATASEEEASKVMQHTESIIGSAAEA